MPSRSPFDWPLHALPGEGGLKLIGRVTQETACASTQPRIIVSIVTTRMHSPVHHAASVVFEPKRTRKFSHSYRCLCAPRLFGTCLHFSGGFPGVFLRIVGFDAMGEGGGGGCILWGCTQPNTTNLLDYAEQILTYPRDMVDLHPMGSHSPPATSPTTRHVKVAFHEPQKRSRKQCRRTFACSR